MLIIGTEAAREAGAVVQWTQSIAVSRVPPPAWPSDLPVIGAPLSGWWRTYIAGSTTVADFFARLDFTTIVEWARSGFAQQTDVVRAFARSVRTVRRY